MIVDGMRPDVRQVEGEGILVTFGNLTLLCTPHGAQSARVGSLIGAVATAALSQAAGGRRMTELLVNLLGIAQPDEYPSLCAFGPADGGIAALAHGDAKLTMVLAGGDLFLDARATTRPVHRLVVQPVQAIHAMIGDLRFDWTPGEGVAVPMDAQAEQVVGIYCSKHHFNDPSVAYCGICGVSMAQADPMPAWGTRPQLGVLVLDEGGVCALMRDHVIGFAPQTDPQVVAGQAGAVRLDDPHVSAVHCRVVLEGWEVYLVDESDATFVRRPGERAWTQLSKGDTVRLRPGTAVACGRRQLHYYSYLARN